MNWPVLIFALGISFVVAIGLGIFTAFRATAGNVQQRLAEHGRSQIGAFSSQRLGRSIIAGQLAITLVLLTGAGLLGRSLIRLLAVDPGFRIENIVTADLIHSAPSDRERIQFLNELLAQLAALPGVREAGATSSLPLAQGLSDGTYVLLNPGEQPPAKCRTWRNCFTTTPARGTPITTRPAKVISVLWEFHSFAVAGSTITTLSTRNTLPSSTKRWRKISGLIRIRWATRLNLATWMEICDRSRSWA